MIKSFEIIKLIYDAKYLAVIIFFVFNFKKKEKKNLTSKFPTHFYIALNIYYQHRSHAPNLR